MERNGSKARRWVYFGAITIVTVAAVSGYVLSVDRQLHTTLLSAQAKPSKDTSEMVGNSHLVRISTNLKPGESTGDAPKIRNVGRSAATIFKDKDGEYYVIGRVQLLKREGGKWKPIRIVENSKYKYGVPSTPKAAAVSNRR